MCRVLADAWYRLVFYLEDTRFQLLADILGDGDGFGAAFAQEAVVQEVTRKLEQKKRYCPHCLDLFSETMLGLLKWKPRLGYMTAVHACAALRAGSAVVERAHLPGQALHATRARGLAAAARTLAEVTYQTSVINEARGVSAQAHATVLKRRGISKVAFAKLATTFRFAGRCKRVQCAETKANARRHVQSVAAKLNGKPRARKADAFRVFRAQHWTSHAKIGTPEFRAESRRLQDEWRQMGPEQRAVYDGAAAVVEDEERRLRTDLIREEFDTATGAALGQSAGKRLKREMFVDTVREVAALPVWSRGTGLMRPATGLAPEFVLCGAADTDEATRKASAKLFDYDPQAIPNPTGPTQPRKTCHAMCAGLCRKDIHAVAAENVAFNIYAVLKTNKKEREHYPLRVSFNTTEATLDMLLCDTVGVGDTALLLLLRPAAGDEELLQVASTGAGPVTMTAQRAVAKLLEDKKAHAGAVDRITMRCYDRVTSAKGAALSFKKSTRVLFEEDLATKFKMKEVLNRRAGVAGGPAAVSLPFGLAGICPDGPGDDGGGLDEATDHPPAFPANGGAVGPAGEVDVIGDDLECDEAAPDAAAVLLEQEARDGAAHPAAARLGIVGFDFANTGRASKCFVCEEKGLPKEAMLIKPTSLRYSYRWRARKPERFVHEDCVLSGALLDLRWHTHAHTVTSSRFLSDAAFDEKHPEPLRRRLRDAEWVFRAAESGAAAASGSAGPPSTSAAPSSGAAASSG